MAVSNWEPDKMLDRYIYDYLVKKNMHECARAFMAEAKVSKEPVEIDAPGGFLHEWWCIFWEMYAARYKQKISEAMAAYLEAKQIQDRERQQQQQSYLEVQQRIARENQQRIRLQQLQMMQQKNAQPEGGYPVNPSLGSSMSAMNCQGIRGNPAASVLDMMVHEKRMNVQLMDADSYTGISDANKIALLQSAANQQCQSLQGNVMGMSAAFRKMEYRNQLANDTRPEGNLSGAQRLLPMGHSPAYGQALAQSNSRMGVAGLNQGVANMPQKMQGLDQLPRNSGAQLQGNNNVQKSSSQQQDHAQQHMQQNNNKRKHQSSSGPANSTGTGNALVQTPSSPPSTHTPNVGATNTPNHHPANLPNNTTMSHPVGNPDLLSPYDHLDDLGNLEDIGPLDDTVVSYFNNNEGDGNSTINQSSNELTGSTTDGTQHPHQT